MDYFKDFEGWNKKKRRLNNRVYLEDFNFHEGDIWWTSIGTNIGSEIDGKNYNFERPCLIIKIISRKIMYILPLTSKMYSDEYHTPISFAGRNSSVVLSQARVVSDKRLLRKIGLISKDQLIEIKSELIKILW